MSFLYHCQDFYRTWLDIWVTRRCLIRRQELLSIRQHMSSIKLFCGYPCSSLFMFCVFLLCVFTFWIPCCAVRYDFRMTTRYLNLELSPLLDLPDDMIDDDLLFLFYKHVSGTWKSWKTSMCTYSIHMFACVHIYERRIHYVTCEQNYTHLSKHAKDICCRS